MNAHDLKAMQVQLAKLEAEFKVMEEDVREKQKALAAIKSRIDGIRKKIATEKESSMPIISEHAMLRLLERIYGIDLDDLKKKVLVPSVVSVIKFGGSGEVSLPMGGRAIFKNNTIVSIKE